MKKHNKVYKMRLYPTVKQEETMLRFAGMVRYTYNWALEQRINYYKEHKKTLNVYEIKRQLTQHKKVEPWLNDAPIACLQDAVFLMHRSFVNFFDKRAKFPKFKSRHKSPPSFSYPQYVKIIVGRAKVPKIGLIKVGNHPEIDCVTKSARIKQDATGKWWLTLVAEFELPEISPQPPKNPVGIDFGLSSFAVLSDGMEVEPAKYYRKAEKKLRRVSKALSRGQRGSNRYNRTKKKVAAVHEKVRNQRSNFINQFTSTIVKEFDGVFVEDLNLKGMMKTRLAKSVADVGIGETVRQLEYKSKWNHKTFGKVDRYYASSKTCNSCGNINKELKLEHRVWTCSTCGSDNDRDWNASKNILDEGIRTHVSHKPQS